MKIQWESCKMGSKCISSLHWLQRMLRWMHLSKHQFYRDSFEWPLQQTSKTLAPPLNQYRIWLNPTLKCEIETIHNSILQNTKWYETKCGETVKIQTRKKKTKPNIPNRRSENSNSFRKDGVEFMPRNFRKKATIAAVCVHLFDFITMNVYCKRLSFKWTQ